MQAIRARSDGSRIVLTEQELAEYYDRLLAPIQPGVVMYVKPGVPATMLSGTPGFEWKACTKTLTVTAIQAGWVAGKPDNRKGTYSFHADDLSLTPWPDAQRPCQQDVDVAQAVARLSQATGVPDQQPIGMIALRFELDPPDQCGPCLANIATRRTFGWDEEGNPDYIPTVGELLDRGYTHFIVPGGDHAPPDAPQLAGPPHNANSDLARLIDAYQTEQPMDQIVEEATARFVSQYGLDPAVSLYEQLEERGLSREQYATWPDAPQPDTPAEQPAQIEPLREYGGIFMSLSRDEEVTRKINEIIQRLNA